MKKLFSFQWHITEKCDQHCSHCYLYQGHDILCQPDMSESSAEIVIKKIIAFCDRFKLTPFVHITGGDPILCDSFWSIIELLSYNKIKFGILGNPFHINDTIVSKLQNAGCEAYQLSLDGLESTHDHIRKPGSFKTTLDAIRILKKSSIKTAVMSTVSKINMSEIPAVVDVIVEYKVDSFGFSRYCPNPGDISTMPTPLEYRDFLYSMWDKYQEYPGLRERFILKDHLWYLFLQENNLFDPSSVNNPKNLILDGCHCGITHLTILTDGTVYACRRSTTPVGNVFDEDLYDIFVSDRMNAYRQYDSFEKCKKCDLLAFCRGCPSVAKCTYGNFYAPDPQCWKEL